MVKSYRTMCGVLFVALIPVTGALAGEISWFGGTYSNWPSTWIPLPGLNDPDDGVAPQVDFVGNDTYPGAYYQWDADYFYFRMRVDVDTISSSGTFSDSLFILIDLPGYGTTADQPDYAFAWDTNAPVANHGVELMVPDTIGNRWSDSRMDDIDDNSGQKISPPDFGPDGDAYLRTIDGVTFGGTGFDTTSSFVDWAISFDHLETNTELGRNQTWYVQLGSIANSNDHGTIATDIAGGYSPSDSVVGSMNTAVTTPEPASTALTLLALGIVGGAVHRRKTGARDGSDRPG